MDHVVARGSDLFAAVCASDLACYAARTCPEGVAKRARGRYHTDGGVTSWLRVRNRQYSQMDDRSELFGARQVGSRSKQARPVLCPELQALQSVL
jgi:hypothetical protein